MRNDTGHGAESRGALALYRIWGQPLGILVAASLASGAAFAQEKPPPRAPPRVQPPTRPPTQPPAATPPDVEGAPGVINRKGDKELDPRFDPKILGKVKDQKKTEDVNVIPITKNYGDKFPCKKLPLDQMVSIDWQNMKLDDITKLMACLMGKRFILPQGVAGQITIMSTEPVTVYEAYKAFISSLEANNLTLVKRDQFYRIVPKTKAKTAGADILGPGRRAPNDDNVVTQLIPIKHLLADEVKELIQSFASDGADITVYNPTNTIILTEIGSNIARLRKLINEVDKPTGAVRIWVRPVEFAAAADIAKQVESVFGKGGPKARPGAGARPARPTPQRPGQPPTPSVPATGGSLGDATGELSIQSDERTNQLIIITDRSTYLRVDKLIRKLDVPIPGEGMIHIHYLENAAAKDVQSTLSALVSGGSGTRKPGQPPTPVARPGQPPPGQAASQNKSVALIGGEVKITAHEPTNSLVIEASLKDYLVLKRVIRQLDVRRKQVYLESVIMEITSDKNRDLGVTGYGGATFNVDGKEVPLIFGNSLGPNISDVQSVMPGGLGALLVGPLIDASLGSTGSSDSASNISIPAFGFALKALQGNSDVNVLQTPHILTTDNEEAELEVGRKIPFNAGVGGLGGLGSLAGLGGLGSLGGASGLTSALGGLGGLGGLASTLGSFSGLGSIQYADIKISLKIKPTVNESNFVRLEVEQQIDDFDGLDQKTGAPNTSNRRVKNIVVVRDQQPVVIGGLMKDSEGESVQKIPILGDIPLFGVFFRQTKRTVSQKNLLMIIIPHIIDDPSDLKRIHEQRMDEIRSFADFLATRKKEYLGQVDYAKKHGLLEEIHQTVEKAKAERYQLEQQNFDDSELDPVGPPDTHDLDYDPYKVEESREGGGRAKNKQKAEPAPKVAPPPPVAPPAEPAPEAAP